MEHEESLRHTETARKVTTGVLPRLVLARAWQFLRESSGKLCMSDKMQNLHFLMLLYPSITQVRRLSLRSLFSPNSGGLMSKTKAISSKAPILNSYALCGSVSQSDFL